LAQASVTRHPIDGTVRAADGHPIAGANVFVIETLEGAFTGADGHFRIATSDTGTVTLAVRRIGFRPTQRTVLARDRDGIAFVLEPGPHALTPMTVEAGRYSAGDRPGATLSSLEVATTPGAASDVNRAIQTLPGVQQVDEGTALYVRGGDYTETKVFLDDAVVLDPRAVQSPDGTFMGTVDPFLLDGIAFSSGGFGARFGNALSGVVDLHTQGRPLQRSLALSAGMAAVSASAAMPLSEGLGVRGAVNLFDLRPLIGVNGSSQRYDPPPRGHDVSGSMVWRPRGAGEVTLFAIEQSNLMAVGVDDPSYSGDYRSRELSDLLVATWTAVFGRLAPSVSVSSSRFDRREGFGAMDLASRLRQQQLSARGEWVASDRITARAGVEIERLRSLLVGSAPTRPYDVGPGSPTRVVGSDGTGVRSAAFGEADLRVADRTRLVFGLRSDASSLTRERTLDPRSSVAFRPRDGVLLTAAWGLYHEVPDPLFFEPVVGDTGLRSMRAAHRVVGVQLGSERRIARVELYDKQYRDLAQQTRDYRTLGGGRGYARGADLFVRADGPWLTTTRVTYSYVLSRRTDPNTGVLADAPFDVPHSATLVVERRFGSGWRLGASYRYATGRPFTPILGGVRDARASGWLPLYGRPMSQRFPDFERVDASVSRVRQLAPGWRGVFYAALNNLLARPNVYDYAYSADYRHRRAVLGLFNRSLYVGATLTH
jgi:hypothetical protein